MKSRIKSYCGICLFLFGFTIVCNLLMIQKTNLNYAPISKFGDSPDAADGIVPTAFISNWNTTAISDGSTNTNQVGLPLESTGVYSFTVDWGDSIINTITSYDQTQVNHTYSVEGIYTINITGFISGWCFNNRRDKLKLLNITQWGSLNLGNSGSYFYGCSNLNLTATDNLNLTGTTTLEQAFFNCASLGASGNMNGWDISHITSMANMFTGATTFNQPIDHWNVSNVWTMYDMFSYASAFNQPIGDWDVSNVITMYCMFGAASNFNQPLNNWDVSNVGDMAAMFLQATNFNQPLNNWNVGNVAFMYLMFSYATTFNQPINNWNVSNVLWMDLMFDSATTFNQPLGNWNVSKVTQMSYMFRNCALSPANYNNLLNGWIANTLETGVTFDAGFSQYTPDASAARNILTTTYSWTITDGGLIDFGIQILTPIEKTVYNGSAPSFEIVVPAASVDTMWYTLDAGVSNHTFATNGTIDLTVWAAVPSGSVITLRFYTNITSGVTAWEEGIIEKDSEAPTILIQSPVHLQSFKTTPPVFSVVVTDPYLELMWYTINGGLTNHTFTTNSTIDATEWSALGESEWITLRFYGNDSVENLGTSFISIKKDILRPSITIVSPIFNALFSSTAPAYNIRLLDSDIDQIWYTLNEGVTNHTITTNGTIDPDAWINTPNGIITLHFYANDTTGNWNTTAVQIQKDNIVPMLVIHSPTSNQRFGTTPPTFSVVITDAHLHTMWYSIDQGYSNYTFTTNGSINLNTWNAVVDGIFTFRVYANDTLGYSCMTETQIYKDTIGPNITLLSVTPVIANGNSTLSFITLISDPHLDSMWYSVDGGVSNHTFTDNGTIDPILWGAFGNNTMVTFRIYAIDSCGNLNYAELRVQKVILVDNNSSGNWDGTIIWSVIGVAGVGLMGGFIFGTKRKNHAIKTPFTPSDLSSSDILDDLAKLDKD